MKCARVVHTHHITYLEHKAEVLTLGHVLVFSSFALHEKQTSVVDQAVSHRVRTNTCLVSTARVSGLASTCMCSVSQSACLQNRNASCRTSDEPEGATMSTDAGVRNPPPPPPFVLFHTGRVKRCTQSQAVVTLNAKQRPISFEIADLQKLERSNFLTMGSHFIMLHHNVRPDRCLALGHING